MTDPVRRQYDRGAPRYDDRWAGYIRLTLDLLEARARIAPHERVLDVACGTGAFVERLVAANPAQHVVGTDVSAGMLALARSKLGRFPNVRFVEAPAEALPFETGSFDIVVSASAFHYFDNPEAALAEMARVLRPGGRLVLLDWDRGRWWMALLDAALRVFDPAHHRTYSAVEINWMLEAAGLDGPDVESVRRGVWGLAIATAYKR